MFDFNTTSSYLALFVFKTPSVAWYFIVDLILLKVHGYFALFELKSTVIFICCLIISFFFNSPIYYTGTRADHGMVSYVVTTYMTTTLHKTEKQIIKEEKKQRRREKEKEKEERRKK